MDVRHVIKVSDERVALNNLLAQGRALVDYYQASGQQLVEPELEFIDALEVVENLARKRREAAQEARNGR